MAKYRTPGVYVEEVSVLPSSVAAVATAIPGFVGYTGEDEKDGVTLVNKPVRITSMLEFEELFGGPFKQSYEVELSGTAGDPVIDINPVNPANSAFAPYILYYQMKMFYANGGGTCYVVSVGKYGSGDINAISETSLSVGLDELEKIDEITLVNIPEIIKLTNAGVIDDAKIKALNDEVLAHCAKMENRFALLDVLHTSGETVFNDAANFRDKNVSQDSLKYGASYYPGLITTQHYAFDDSGVEIVSDSRGASSNFAEDSLEAVKNTDTTLYNQIVAVLNRFFVELYPSSSMAGIYARVDNQRGVWKAPANVGIRNVRELSVLLTDQEQALLNIDTVSGKSINAIRQFEGRGMLVWGARTLDGNSNEWRFINVRRLFLFVEQSVKNASQFVVFEPNSAVTWKRVESMINSFLTLLWRNGGLVGATTEEAFFVSVGVGKTMTIQDVLEGRMIVEIGLAASRPSEFIILKFSHFIQQES